MTIDYLTGLECPTDIVKKINEIIDYSGSGNEVGDYIWRSLPTEDGGKHLADGALIQGGGIYNAFVNKIAALYANNPTANYFTDEATWQNTVTTYGSCGKYVYDSVNNTVRLPKVSDIVQGTTDLSALGDLVEAGLPDHNHTYIQAVNRTASFMAPGSPGSQSDTTSLTGYASASNPIYGNSSTVQPQTIKALLYIVIATSTKTDIEVDIDEIATDLNGKVDKSDLAEVQCVVETYQNGTSWYRVWSDGWCEQGGEALVSGNSSAIINLLKTFKDMNYSPVVTPQTTTTDNMDGWGCTRVSTNSIRITLGFGSASTMTWQACGYMEV